MRTAAVAARITMAASIPTIGIGAGSATDGQVLVLHDFAGVGATPPRFVRRYMDGERLVAEALNAYDTDVRACNFRRRRESY